MGLGKTLQAISFLSYLKVHQISPTPFCELNTFFYYWFSKTVGQFLLHKFGLILFFVVMFFIVVLCPLSVTDGWVSEIVKFAPCLKVLQYVGDKETRRNARRRMCEHATEQPVSDVSLMTLYVLSSRWEVFVFWSGSVFDVWSYWKFWQALFPFDILLTTYDIALMDQDFLSQIPWQYAVIDEAQRLKNPSSVCKGIICYLFYLWTYTIPNLQKDLC